MGKIVLAVIIVIAILVVIYINSIAEYAFSKAFNKHKKTKEEAIEYLKKKNLFDEKIYNEVQFEEVEIKSVDNLELRGYLVEKYKNSNKYIILVHGYTANHYVHTAFLRFFIDQGYNVLLVDERAHGKSEGKYLSYGYYEKMDIDRWIDYLYKRTGKDLFLGLHGQSMGGATVLMCGARNKNVKFIIEDCGYSDAKKVIKHQFAAFNWIPFNTVYLFLKLKVRRRAFFKLKEVSPIADIKDIKTPIMFVHGKADTYVPCSMAIEMYNCRNNKNDRLLLVDKAEHMWSYSLKKEEYQSIMQEFLANVQKINENE